MYNKCAATYKADSTIFLSSGNVDIELSIIEHMGARVIVCFTVTEYNEAIVVLFSAPIARHNVWRGRQ